jgi:hypothetical protein
MLGRVAYTLNAKNRMQETMAEFRQDWALLEQTRSRVQSLPIARVASPPAPDNAPIAVRP